MAEYFLNDIFSAENHLNGSARALPGTTELTALASNLASQVIRSMEADIEVYKPRIATSALNNSELDTIINELLPEYGDQADFLLELDDTTVSNMLKSQQSKRSRSKSKQMTLANYQVLMTAAIAERIIREKTGKTKSASHVGRAAATVDFTIEQLEMLAADQEELKKAIRNVQSKKSIMKSKADFDETSERWQSLLRVEQQLKDLRTGATPQTIEVEVDYTKTFIEHLMQDVDADGIEHMKATEMRAMLMSIYNHVFAGDEEPTND